MKIRKLNFADIRTVARILNSADITPQEFRALLSNSVALASDPEILTKDPGAFADAIYPLFEAVLSILAHSDSFYSFAADLYGINQDELSTLGIGAFLDMFRQIAQDPEIISFFPSPSPKARKDQSQESRTTSCPHTAAPGSNT